MNCLAETPAAANFCPACGVKLASDMVHDELSAIAENAPDVLWSVDAAGRFTYVSPSVLRLFGFSAEDCIGKSVIGEEPCAPGLSARASEICAAEVGRAAEGSGDQALFEIEIETRDGRLVPVEVNAVAVRDASSGILQIQGVLREISARKRALAAEAREAEVERLVAQIAASFINVPTAEIDDAIDSSLAAVGHFAGVDSNTIVLAEQDGDGFVLAYSWNRQDFAPALSRGQRFASDDLPWMHAKLRAGETVSAATLEDLPPEAERERELMSEAGLDPLIVTPLVMAGRLCGYAALSMRGRLPDWTSQTLGLLRFVGDVVVNAVERTRAAEDAPRLERDLRQAQKMEAVGTLAGGIAHDFNNLLTSILGGIEFGLLELPADSEAAEGLRVAQEAGERAADLTGRMLTLSRRQEPDMRPTNLNEVVTRTVDFLRRSIPEDVVIRIETDPMIPEIQADEGQLGQALLNLGINARDSMPDGGEILIATRVGRDVDDSDGISVALITVTDNGAGIDAESLPHIFEPFYTTKSIGKGTGLGLAMAYGCARAHGGRLSVESEPGKGSAFELMLPLTQPVAGRAAAPVSAEVTRASATILLVDDMDTVLQIARGMLERAGYEVISAQSCEEALQHFDRSRDRIGAVVTDLVMPGGSGRDLLKALRARGATVPVVLTSGYLADTSREEVEAEGFACLLAKPFSRRTLSLAVQEVVGPSESAQTA
jgi:PAS domain S-box-containing protein